MPTRRSARFATHWIEGAERGSRRLMRRVMAALRLAHRSLGMKRNRLGLGALGVAGAARRAVPLAMLVGLAAGPATAADRYWDVNGTSLGSGGASTWNTANPSWSPNNDGTSGPYSAWSNGALDDAFFGGTAGIVTLGVPVTAHNITFQVNGYTITGNTLTLGGIDPTLSVATGAATINSMINGTGRVIKAGAGGLTLTGNNDFTGGLTVSAGSLSLTGNNSFGSSPVVTGGALSLTGTNSFVGDISINGALTASGAAALGDAGNNINISAGSLNIGTTGGSLTGRVVTLSGTGNIGIAGAGIGGAHFTGTGGLGVSPGVNLTDDTNDYTGATSFSGAGSSTFTSIGNLGEASSLGAPATVAAGTISISNPIGTTGTRVVSYIGDGDVSNRNWALTSNGYRGTNLTNNGTGTLTLTGAIAVNRTSLAQTPSFTAGTADLELLGVISGNTASFNANAGHVLRLGDANILSGISIGGAGKVVAATLANAGVASSLGAGSSTTITGTLSYIGAGASTNRDWSVNNGTLSNDGSGALTLSGTMSVTNTATLGGSFTGAGNEFSGVIAGSGNLRGAGAGTWVISGANTYTGETIVDSGTLRAGSADAFTSSTRFQVNGGTLDLNGFSQTLTTLTGTGGTLELGSGELTIEAPTGTTASFAGSIAGSGGLTKLGASTQTLTGASTYTGATTIGGGILALDFSPAGGPTSNIIGSASTLNMVGGRLDIVGAAGEANTQTFGGLTITGGNNTIDAMSGTGGSLTVNLGAITRTGGLMNFNLPTNGNITTSNTSLGGWATVNGTDYAKVAGGNILAFTEADYTDKDNAADWLDNEFITDVTGFYGTVTGTKQLGGLRYTQPVSTIVNVDPGQTLGVDGTIIVAPTVLGGNQMITGGKMTGANGGVLGVQQNSTGNFTIASQIADNGPGMGFTKAGTGLVTLTNTANSYTGATQVVQGTLAVTSIGNGGAVSSIGASSADPSNLMLEGGTLRYTGAGDSSDRGFTFAKSGAITGAGVEVTNPNANLVFSGLVTSPDGADFTKSGPGTLTLANAANDYTGMTTVTGGLLAMSTLPDGGQLSPIGQSSSDPANLVLNGGGLRYTGSTTTTDRGFTLGTGGGVIDVSTSDTTLTVGGQVVGAGGLTKNGAGTLILTAANTYTGGNTVNSGVLRAGAANVLGGSGPMTLANTAGASLDLNNFNNVIGALNGGGANGGNVTLGSATLQINGGNGNYSGTISGTGGILRTGAGVQVFNGCNNSYTGPTTLQGAISTDCIRNGGQPSGIGASGSASSNLLFNNGALIYTGDTVTTDRGFQLPGASNVISVDKAATTLTFTGTVSGGGGLSKNGPGTLVLAGTNTSPGNMQVNGGILRAATTNAFGPQGHMILSNTAGALLDLDGYDAAVTSLIGGGTAGGNISLGDATLTINGVDTRSYAGAISGTGRLVKNGNNIQALSGCNSSYTGGTTVNGGTLQVTCLANGGLNSSIGASSSDPANLVLNGGTLRYVGTATSTDRQFTLGAGSSTLDSSGTGAIQFTYGGPVTLAGGNAPRTLTLTGASTGTNILAARLDDNGTGITSLTKTDAGTWRLTNQASSYTGATTISGGILIVDKLADGGAASSIGASSSAMGNLVIGNGSTLRYVGAGDITDRQFTLDTGVTYIQSSGTGALVFENTGTVGLTGTNATRTIALGGTNTGYNTMGGAIGDNGTGATTLAKNDSGTWVLTGNNTYSGNTVINNGNLMIGNGGTTGNAGIGNVIVDSATSTLSLNRSDTFTFAGTLSGPGTLAQIGTGTSVLTSASNQIGATTISAGTLQIGGGLLTPTIAMTGSSTLAVTGTVGGNGVPATISGDGSSSVVNVNSGGTLTSIGDLGDGSDAVMLAGTLDTGAGTLNLGAGNDTLTLNDGGVIAGSVTGGAGTNTLVVNNAAARTLDASQAVSFQNLVKQNSGTLTLTGNNDFSAGTTIQAGILQIGNGGASGTLGSGNVLNNGTLAFNRTGTLAMIGAISGAGAVNQIGGGTTILSGNNSYTGATTVAAGTLIVNGNQAAATGAVSVASGATLGGNGAIGGSVTVASGGTLAPGDVGNVPGALRISQNLTLNSGAVLNYDLGQANAVGGPLNDLVTVGGNLTLAGTLNVSTSAGGSFSPGLYRVMSYGGTLTDNGLTIGAIPSPDFFLQTSVANQVNLVNTSGLTLNFWDGAAGPKNNGVVNGGNGVWQSSTGNDNWTTPTGTPNAPFTDAAFAVFAGSGGNVAIDNNLGQVTAAGMQFAADGYRLSGGSIALVGTPDSILRVGDGTAAGASFVATIDSVLSGNTRLVKADLGTVVLNGVNTYTGGTAINGGTVRVSSDANLGAAGGALSFDGGRLQNTAAMTTARAVTLNAGGGTFQTDASLALSGVIDGAGALIKTGAATLTLTGSNIYSGGTTISAGTLQLGDGGASGSILGDIVNNAALAFNRSDTLIAPGAISGGGSVAQIGGGTTILTGDSTYTGGTTISAGTLQLGNGGATGSIVGDVGNNGALAFNRSDTYGFTGLISGTGAVSQIGGGMTILTANNSYGGATTVSAGTLIINGDQTAALGPTAVATGGTLGGSGIVGGSVNVTDGNINPGNPGNAPGTLTIQRNLSLAGNSSLNYNFGQANVVGGPLNDLTVVKGDLTLDGTINVAVTGGGNFDAGIYRVISYSGSLTDHGLQAGTTPSSNYFVQTSVANQVNLVNTAGLTLNFWDGGAGPKFDNAVNGGNGIWQSSAGNDNWTTMAGDINAPFSNASFAIFSATPGRVTVDNGLGQVAAAGMQFASNGYHLVGGEIALAGSPTSVIRVGDGTLVGAGFVATIDNVLSGNTQLVKTDLGTLVLNGVNTYAGGTAINGGTLRIAQDANLGAAAGALSLDGGTLQNTAALVTARGVTLNAGGGTLQTEANLALSGVIDGSGAVTKTGAATLTLTGNNVYTGGTTIAAGTLQLGDGGASGSIAGSIVNHAALTFNRSDALTLGGVISGSGAVNQIGSGTTVLTGSNSYAGPTTVSAGTLIVNGDQSAATGATFVNAGGVLGGVGTLGGSVAVADGGAINPGNVGGVGTLTVNGNLALGSGSVLNYDFGQANVAGGALNDLTIVHGDLTLGGMLNVNVASGGSFGPGVYRVINYDGSLSDNGLALGAIPSSEVFVQTAVAHQVNLVNTAGLTLNFWDGAAGPGFNNAVNGGDGVWQSSAGNDHWTNNTGAINAPFTDAAFAIFSATPGTVTVDNSLGQVMASGMQFSSDGYRIVGGEIALAGSTSIMRVGDGTAAGASHVATIDSVLSGATQLVKTDLGTLVLNGVNTYAGGTAINGGTVRVAQDASLGAASGGLSFDGGTLQNTSAFTTARAVTLDGAGGTFQTDAALTVAGTIAGAGRLTKTGAGVLVLTGANSHAGGTTISAGTLQLGSGGASGSILGEVLNNATLAFNRSDTVDYSGTISGAGTIRQIGSGLTNLTGDSSAFAGRTSIEAGILAVNGALCGSVDVRAGGTLSGTGTVCGVNNAGTVAPGNDAVGTLTVAGTYTGLGGTLQLETELGGDASPTDRLVVTGDTAGSTAVRVRNQRGIGAPTVEGIKVIDVGGASNGRFTLLGDYAINDQPAVIAGAYAYTLQKNGVAIPGDGDWYLRSSLINPPAGAPTGPLYQPGAPLYEAYPQLLLGLNGLPTLRQRVGDRYELDGSPAAGTVLGGSAAAQVVWGRIEGQHNSVQPDRSTTGTRSDADQLRLQAGLDSLLLENKMGRLFGGFTAQYGRVSADIRSFFGAGKTSIDGYSLGSTLTWSGRDGFYLDGQAQATRFDGTLTSDLTGRRMVNGNKGFGYAFGLEAGQRFALSGAWSLTPQAQLVYSKADFDSFVDPFGARVSLGKGESLTGRLGLATDYRSAWKDGSGRMMRSNLYGVANLYYDFLGDTSVNVGGTRLASGGDRLWGGLGVGGSLSWNDDGYAVYGEASVKLNLAHPGDSYSYQGTAGFRMRW